MSSEAGQLAEAEPSGAIPGASLAEGVAALGPESFDLGKED
jgi:hypothetical protein